MKALKKLIPAAAMLLLCAAMMTTATFAWFNMNNAVTVDSITTTVTAPVNLQISASADTGWTTALTGITGSAGDNGLNPVKTTDMTAWETTNKSNDAGVASGTLSTVTLDATGQCTNEPVGDEWAKDKFFFTTYTIYLKNVGGTETSVYIDTGTATTISANTATPNSTDLVKSVTFAAQATGGTIPKNQQFVQDSTDTGLTKVTGYEVVTKDAANSLPMVTLAAQATATVKITVWMAGDSTHCKTLNVKDAELKFDFKLGFTTVAPTATP